MLSYKQEPSKKAGIEKITLKEKQMKWLNDDYVKFIRIAQEYITKGVHSDGLIGFITPHGFIDNPTFRGMRYNLLKTFDKLYILNLHGNAKKKETAPDGSKDENVFDIQQGVAITFFVKTNKKNSQSLGEVYYADLYGLRAEKYEFLNSHSVGDIRYQKADPTLENMYRFDIQDETLRLEWEQMRPINTLFKINNVGLVSARDNLCIQNTSDEVIQVIQKFINLSEEDAAYRVFDFCASLNVVILINNAGIFEFRQIENMPSNRVEIFMGLHMATFTRLCRLFSKNMAQKSMRKE